MQVFCRLRPFRYVCPPPSAPSSWRNNGSMWRHKWWQTSHRDGLRWYLQKRQRVIIFHDKVRWCRSCESRTALTFGVQEFGEPQVLLRQVEGVLQVVVSVGLLQFVEINQVWPGKIASIENEGYEVYKAKVLMQVKWSCYLCLWMRALKAIPSRQLVLKLWMLTLG